jgi:acyl-CoA synthetase (AMP-forming)/AMP-acid ligase II
MGWRKLLPSGELESKFSWLTYKEVFQRIRAFGAGLRHLMLPKEVLGICSRNRIEHYIADIGGLLHGMVVIPLHYSYNSEQVGHYPLHVALVIFHSRGSDI